MSATRPDGAPEVTEPSLVPGLMIHGSHVVTFNYLNYTPTPPKPEGIACQPDRRRFCSHP